MISLRFMPVRYRVLVVLIALSFINYLLRNNISVAIPSIRQEFDFSNAEIGWILGSFNISYAMETVWAGMLDLDIADDKPGVLECALFIAVMAASLLALLARKLRPVEVVR